MLPTVAATGTRLGLAKSLNCVLLLPLKPSSRQVRQFGQRVCPFMAFCRGTSQPSAAPRNSGPVAAGALRDLRAG